MRGATARGVYVERAVKQEQHEQGGQAFTVHVGLRRACFTTPNIWGTLHKNTIILVMLSTNDPCFCNITQHKTQGFGRGVKYMQL